MNLHRHLPILLYHSVSTGASRAFRPWTVTARQFEHHLSYLAETGYTAMTIGELVEAIASASPALPAKPVAITFDDGFADFHEAAQPALDRVGFRSTLYVSTAYIGATSRWLARHQEGNRPMLSRLQLRDLAHRGVEIGAHGCTHRALDELPPAIARQEIARSKAELEDIVGEPVSTFAYPHGYAGHRERAMVEQEGFLSAAAVRHAMSSPRDDVFGLARIIVSADTDVPALAALLDGWGLRHAPRSPSRCAPRRGASPATPGGGSPPAMARSRHGGLTAAAAAGWAAMVVANAARRDAWWELMQADGDALPTQSPDWVDAVCAATGGRNVSRLYETADGRRAVLPLVRRAHTPVGPVTLDSMPAAWGYGGLVAPEGVDADLVRRVLDDLSGERALRLHVRPNPLHASAWEAAAAARPGLSTVTRCAHVLDLAGGFDRVWGDRFRSATRTQVRRAERAGLSVETDTTGRLIPVFYELLERSFDRWARNQHEPRPLARWRARRRDPLTKFVAMASVLGGACQVSVGYDGPRPVAAIVVLVGAHNAHYTRGAMDESVASSSLANRLLHKVAIEEACRRGCRAYHMGESGQSKGLAQFKSLFGAQPHSYTEYWIERLPVHRVDRTVRSAVKRVIGFHDA